MVPGSERAEFRSHSSHLTVQSKEANRRKAMQLDLVAAFSTNRSKLVCLCDPCGLEEAHATGREEKLDGLMADKLDTLLAFSWLERMVNE